MTTPAAYFGKSAREALEDAIVDELKRVTYVKTRLPWVGDPRSEEGQDQIRALVGMNTPAVLIQTTDSKDIAHDVRKRNYREEIGVELTLVGVNYRNRNTQRRGDDRARLSDDPGIYRLAEDIKRRLVGWMPPGVTGGVLRPAGLVVVLQTAAQSIWDLQFVAPTDFEAIDHQAEDAPDLDELAGQLHFAGDDDVLFSGGGASPARTISFAAGVCTLTDPAAAFGASLPGADIEIVDPVVAANAGRFRITSRPSATTIRWSNPRGAAETYSGTYEIKFPSPATLTVTVEEE